MSTFETPVPSAPEPTPAVETPVIPDPVEPTVVTPVAVPEPTIADVLAAFNDLKQEYETFKQNPAVSAINRVLEDGGPDRMSGFSHEEEKVRGWIRDEFDKLTAAA